LAIFYIYGIDVPINRAITQGNLDQMRLEVENLSKISEIFISSKDSFTFSRLFKGKVKHLSSRLYGLPDTTIGKFLSAVLFSGTGFISLLKRVKKVDVIVSQGTTSLHGALANLLFHKPTILYLQYFAYNEQSLLGRNVLSPLFRLVELFSIHNCTLVVAPNERLKAQAIECGAKSVKIIPNFVNTSEIDKIGDKSGVRQKLGMSQSTHVVLFVGRLHPVKNIPLLLRAFSLLDGLEDCSLIIIGDGPEKQRLIDLASSLGITGRVHFEGFKPKKIVYEYMKASDVLVLPSIVEGQPRVILEAWACELPVVASKVNGVENLVINGFNGFLFDLASEADLVNAISQALKDDVVSAIRVNSKRQIISYSIDSVLLLQEKVARQFLPKSSGYLSYE
jgi:glycosyltransferase involved in cell wall biosynthesis